MLRCQSMHEAIHFVILRTMPGAVQNLTQPRILATPFCGQLTKAVDGIFRLRPKGCHDPLHSGIRIGLERIVEDGRGPDRFELPHASCLKQVDATPIAYSANTFAKLRTLTHCPRVLLTCRLSDIVFRLSLVLRTGCAALIDEDPSQAFVL